jgi:hypothetical protein
MATHTRAELPVVFDCNLGEGGLDEFEPEDQRGALRLRVDSPIAVDTPRWEPYVARAASRRWPFVVPVVIAAAMAGAAVSWLGTRPGFDALPVAPPPPATSEVSTGVPREPVFVAPVSGSTASGPAAPARIDPAFERTLASVSQSYRALDAALLTAVWPGADTARLSRDFADLKYQTLSFDHCAVRPNGDSSAVASCDVLIAAAPKAGDPALQRRHESWTLLLDRSGERWTITGASVR